MSVKPTVLVVNNFHPETIEKLASLYHTYHLWEFSDPEKAELIKNLQHKCNAVASASWMFDEIVYDLSSIEIISCFGVGVDAIDFDITRDRNIKVTNTPDVLNDSVADIAMTLILTTSRNIINADKFVRNNDWLDGSFPFGYSLDGKTLGIIGLGRIGEAIAKRALTFGLDIAYHNRSAKDLPFTYFPSLLELAEASDILLCMLPGGENTQNIIGSDVFKKLGPSGTFINIGRGSSVEESALIKALQNKEIRAAGLDVYANEPRVPAALLGMNNVTLLPHIGSATIETRREMGNLQTKNLEAYFSGQSLLTEVA